MSTCEYLKKALSMDVSCHIAGFRMVLPFLVPPIYPRRANPLSMLDQANTNLSGSYKVFPHLQLCVLEYISLLLLPNPADRTGHAIC